MKFKLNIRLLLTLFFSTIIFLSSCGKRKELRQQGCVKGRAFIGAPRYCIGAMSKKDFFLYLDSPYVKVPEGIINSEMTWTKIDSPTECPVDI